ncbi:MAG: MarR family transcriptional regulator [Clostridia bacterium]|nr:MarR family transcriptional regulator [Clostridia bacterium]
MEEKIPLGRLILRTANILKRSADENLVNENMTVEQLQVLKMINEKGGSVLQKDIEKEFGVRRSTTTSAMQILEKKGYIERFSSPDDSRAKTVVLTDAGKEKNKRLISFIKNRDEKFFGVLTKEEENTLTELIRKLLDGAGKE